MKIDDLKKILETEEVMNNPQLKEELELLLKNQYSNEVSYIYSGRSFNITTYQYLLERGLDAKLILETAITNHDEKLLDLVLTNKIDWNSVSAYSIKTSTLSEAHKLLEHGLSSRILLEAALQVESGEKHDQLLELALSSKPNFSKLYYLPDSTSEADLEKMIAHGLSATKLLNLACNSESSMELFDYLITQIEDFKNIKALPTNLSSEQYQDLIVKGVNPDALLETSVRLLQREDSEEITQKAFELIKLALDNGADINADYGSGTLFENSRDPEVMEFLISHGAKCTDGILDEITEGGITEILFNPQITDEKKFKNLDAPKSEEAKMPYLVHQIWLTSSDNPKEIREQDLKIALETKETFAKAPVAWQQIVWTNDKTLFPKTVKILEENGIQVKSFYDYKADLALIEVVENAISQQKWGIASDSLRYALVNEFGGLYADLNFNFKRDTTDEAHKYNFFTQEYGAHYIDNFFFGASPHHPIIEDIIRFVERNIVNPPEYISRIKDQSSSVITDMATANPTYIAYYAQANKNGNIDVVYPKENHYRDIDSEFTEERNFAGFKDLLSKNCPDLMWLKNLMTHHNFFDDVCIAEKFIIGEDAQDGKTWIDTE